MRFVASFFNERANRLQSEGDHAGAIRAYHRAIKWDRRWSVPWFNLGLLFKRRGEWQESLTHNERAVELNPSDEGAWWNLGIAATALGKWQRAREAWRSCGIEIPDGDGPPELNFGLVPVRLNPDTDAEVVWCNRIDPARAVIVNVPLPESEHRFGDLVLHDGASNGSRVLRGVEVPVFDELELLQPSQHGTFIIRLAGITASEADELTQAAAAAGIEAEDWTANIRTLCARCSEGKVDRDHEHEPAEDSTYRTIGVAATSEAAVRALIEPLTEGVPSAVIESIDCALPPLPVQ